MATNIYWPGSLPQQMLINGYNENPVDNLIRTPMDAAIPKQRARYPNPLIQRQANFLMTNAQLATFKSFVKDTIGGGALEFYLPAIGDNTTYDVVRFTNGGGGSNGIWSAAPSGQYWVVVLSLEVIP